MAGQLAWRATNQLVGSGHLQVGEGFVDEHGGTRLSDAAGSEPSGSARQPVAPPPLGTAWAKPQVDDAVLWRRLRGSNPGSDSSVTAGRRHEHALICGFSLPLVTTRARREPGVPGVMRTQCGPWGFGSAPVDRPDLLLASQFGRCCYLRGGKRRRSRLLRGCPWLSARDRSDRCEWRACGTAGEDDPRTPRRRWLRLDRRVRPFLGDHRLVGKESGGLVAVAHRDQNDPRAVLAGAVLGSAMPSSWPDAEVSFRPVPRSSQVSRRVP
jgi:hypothetical protein